MAQNPPSPRAYYPVSNHSASSGSAQPPSPSLPQEDGSPNHRASQLKSDQDVPIDPSIAASSPTYPPQGPQQYSYPPQQHEMAHGYPQHQGPMYAQPHRPEWGAYSQHAQHMPPPYASGVPTSAAPAPRGPGQVCSHSIPSKTPMRRVKT